MDSEQLIDKVQVLLLGMEERLLARMEERNGPRFDKINARLDGVDARLDRLETKVDSLSREVRLNNELLRPFIAWSHQIEDEVIRLSAQLQDVQARLKKLETPQTQ
jgi:hypothetical protein